MVTMVGPVRMPLHSVQTVKVKVARTQAVGGFATSPMRGVSLAPVTLNLATHLTSGEKSSGDSLLQVPWTAFQSFCFGSLLSTLKGSAPIEPERLPPSALMISHVADAVIRTMPGQVPAPRVQRMVPLTVNGTSTVIDFAAIILFLSLTFSKLKEAPFPWLGERLRNWISAQ